MPFPYIPEFNPMVHEKAEIIFGKARFSILTDRIIRLEYQENGLFENHPSQIFWYRNQPTPQFSKKIDGQKLTISTDFLLLEYKDSPKGFNKRTLTITLKQNGHIWHYGDNNRRAKNLLGTARTLDGITGRTKLEDGLISRKGWALVDDSGSLVFNQQGWLSERKNKGIDLYFFGYAQEYKDCLADFIKIAGKIPMIPRYILGNWWSRYWAYSESELIDLINQFRAHQVPLSVCIIDMDWHITQTGKRFFGVDRLYLE